MCERWLKECSDADGRCPSRRDVLGQARPERDSDRPAADSGDSTRSALLLEIRFGLLFCCTEAGRPRSLYASSVVSRGRSITSLASEMLCDSGLRISIPRTNGASISSASGCDRVRSVEEMVALS